jgi:hypothetical protein
MRTLAALALGGQLGMVLAHAVGSSSPDPWTAAGQFGASGVLAGLLWIQLGKAEKRAEVAEARTIAALQETVPVLALATERLSDKVDKQAPITDADMRINQILEKIDRRLGGKG